MEVKSYNEQNGEITIELVDNNETFKFNRLSNSNKWCLINLKKKGEFDIIAGPYGISYMSKNFFRSIRHVNGIAKEDFVKAGQKNQYDYYYIYDIDNVDVREYLQSKKITKRSKKYNQFAVDLEKSTKEMLNYVSYSEKFIPVLDEIIKERNTSNSESEIVKKLGAK